jgi:hypothetical protein
VVATQVHRAALDDSLIGRGIDLPRARSTRRYLALDAKELLARFHDRWLDQSDPVQRALERPHSPDVISSALCLPGELLLDGPFVDPQPRRHQLASRTEDLGGQTRASVVDPTEERDLEYYQRRRGGVAGGRG